MKKSLQLKEKRAGLVDELKGINAAAGNSENNELTDDQVKRVGEIRAAITKIDSQIEAAKYLEAQELDATQRQLNADDNEQRQRVARVAGGNATGGSEARDKAALARQFSFRAAIAAAVKGQQLTGVEKELREEGEQEARSNGVSTEGIALPGFLVGKAKGAPEQRADLTVADATFAGNLVQNTIGEVVEYLYPRTVLRDLGANFITGLRDGFDLINQDGAATATWEGEVDAGAETNPTVAKTAVRPKRLGAYTIFSKQLVNQAVLDVENWVRAELGIAVGQALEVAAINGSGTAPIPRGILNISGIGDVAGGTNGAVPTWGNMVGLETAINAANAQMGRRAYLTTPGVNGLLKEVKKDAGSGIFINDGGMVNGYPMLFTSNVPSTLDKGTSSGVCHAVIFGNWEELYVMQWGGIDLVVNPYSLDTTSQVRVTINTWWDIAVRHKESFAAMQDALLS